VRRRAPLGPAYARLWSASAASNLADGVFQVALPLLAVTLTRSPTLVAGVVLAQRLPWLLVALPAGALADRIDRRQTMIRVDGVRVAVMGGLAVAVAAGVASLPLLYVAALVLGVGETLFDTAAQSIMPSLVDRDRLSEANGRLYAVELVTNGFVGPPLGGLLVAAAMAGAFGFSAAAYLLAALVLAGIAGSYRPSRTGPPTRIRAEIAEGLRFVWRNPVLRTLGIMLGMTNMAATAHQTIFVLYAVDPGPMGLSEAGYGLLFASAAVGGVIGSQMAAPVERALGIRPSLVLALLLFGGTLIVPALTAAVAPNVAAFVLAGIGGIVWNVITVSLRQRITPDRLLGRMNAAYRLLGWGMMPLGAGLGGLLAEAFGLRTTFAVAALFHVPLLAGFLVLTPARLAAAQAEPTAV
jgi:MFS family permease